MTCKLSSHSGEENGDLVPLLEGWEVATSNWDKESLAAGSNGVANESSLTILRVGLDRGANERNKRCGVAEGAVRRRNREEKRGLTDKTRRSDGDIVLGHSVKESSVLGVDSYIDATGRGAHGKGAWENEASA